MLQTTLEIARITPMSRQRRAEKGTIAVVDLVMKDGNGNPLVVLRDLWLNRNTNKETNQEFLSLKSAEYEDTSSGARARPDGNGNYRKIPYTICPRPTEKAFTFYPDSSSEYYQRLCQSIEQRADEELTRREAEEGNTNSAPQAASAPATTSVNEGVASGLL